jgi:regulator of protease activity HflC (stomatin/prohibitin superfamily)
MFDWLNQLIHSFGSLFPRLVRIRSTDRGVKWPRCKKAVLLNPGLHVYWPLVSELEIVTVVRQTIDHKPQTITLRDGVTICVRAVTVWRIADAVMVWTENWDICNTVDDLATASLVDILSCMTKEQVSSISLVNNLATLESQKLLAPYGVAVESTKLIECSVCRSIRLINN